jgi:hypothetical protein
MDHGTIELICVAVIAGAVLIQTMILIGFVLGLGKTAKSIKNEVDDLRSSVLPALRNAAELFVRISPKVESTVTDVSELTRLARTQAAEAQDSFEQILQSVRAQTVRIDGMLTGTLDAVDKAAAFATNAVSKPVRQISGVLASIKAIVESLTSSGAPSRPVESNEDKDMFV